VSLGFDLRDKPSCKDVREASGIEAVVNMYLPGGKRVGKEWVARNPTRNDAKPGSFKVHLTRGCWSDFVMNGESGGDMIDLVAYLTGKTITESKDELAARFGVQGAKWSDSLTGNIRQPRDDNEVPKKEKKEKKANEAIAATPAEAATAPSSFPLWTTPDEDGKPRLYSDRDDGPKTPWINEKRRHFYCQGGVRVRTKIMVEDEGGGALNVYRVVDPDGNVGWQFKGPAGYKELPYLSNGPVLTLVDTPLFWTEGEKDTDSVVKHGGIAFTFGGTGDGLPQGCEQFVVGRHVIITADNDEPGRTHAEEKATLAATVAASVKVVHFPELQEKGDVSDFLIDHSFGDLMALAEATPTWRIKTGEQQQENGQSTQEEPPKDKPSAAPPNKLPYGYGFSDRGLMWKDPDNADKPAMHIAGCFDIEAMTRNGDGNSWGLLLRWKDQDGRDHRFALAHELLAGDGLDARRVLTSQGFYIAPNPSARSKFNAFLLQVTSPNRALATESVGWNGSAFVLPDECFGGNAGETLLLQNATSHEHSFRQSGTLEEWQQAIARPAAGNSRLVFAVSMAFVGPLLGPWPMAQARSAAAPMVRHVRRQNSA
jgi:putative DNA primase/helicase